jgi:pentose-5-phosphate-3-epimerase
MSEIIPAILEKNFNEIKNKLSALREVVRCVHIDICDGILVPSQTWPFSSGGMDDYDFHKIMNEQEGMPFWEEFDFEFDLMVADAVENFDLYMKLGPKRIIFHPNIGDNLEEFEHFLEGLDMYMGLSSTKTTCSSLRLNWLVTTGKKQTSFEKLSVKKSLQKWQHKEKNLLKE